MSSSNLNDEDLLAAVRCRPAMYDKFHKDHCNRDLLRRLWKEIAAETGVDVMVCKTRWNSMRDYFLRKYREGNRPGQPTPNGKRIWPYFDMLSFLIPFVSINRDFSNGSINTTGDGADGFDGEDTGSTGNGNNTPAETPTKIEPRSRSASPVDSETNHSIPPVTPRPSISHPHSSHNAIRIANVNTLRKRKVNTVSNVKPVKVVKREENSHEHFFRSILPMLEKFSDIETLMFRSEVNSLVLKYLQRQDPVPVVASAAEQHQEDASSFSVYLQDQASPE
ncbi:transcription factor Adf-1 [Elysia marginata]|uniref:Transcription factor Adf-1 n=1 Tax=Elysia marginata TaxID=1093978 RepID=A0AAV4H905_9GAST|nr:transcription factor Adf-1 [Elysia marginata]